MPEITIIVPVYNGEKFLSACINSILKQTFLEWNLIIVNDGSTDSTANIADKYAMSDKRISVIHQNNSGLAASRNRGYQKVSNSSEYVMFLDSDDTLEPDALKILCSILDDNPQAPAVHGGKQYIDAEGYILSFSKHDKLSATRWAIINNRAKPLSLEQNTGFNALVLTNTITTPGQVLIRRKALNTKEVFDQAFNGVADWDLWLRISLTSDILYVDKIVLNYRLHSNKMSSKVKMMNKEIERLYKKFQKKPSKLTLEQHHLLLIGYNWRFWLKSKFSLIWFREALEKKEFLQIIKQLRHVIVAYSRFLTIKIIRGFLYHT